MNLAENIKYPREINGIIRRYYAVWMTYALAGGFLFGVYPIFLKARGLNQFEINSVLAMYFVVLFLTDVPTGAFADALGRRRSFVLGAALRVCAFLLYFTAHHYWVFLIGESIDGIGTTFGNGAIDAWGVDALDDAGLRGPQGRAVLADLAAHHRRLHDLVDRRRIHRRYQYRMAMAVRRGRIRDRGDHRRIPDDGREAARLGRRPRGVAAADRAARWSTESAEASAIARC